MKGKALALLVAACCGPISGIFGYFAVRHIQANRYVLAAFCVLGVLATWVALPLILAMAVDFLLAAIAAK